VLFMTKLNTCEVTAEMQTRQAGLSHTLLKAYDPLWHFRQTERCLVGAAAGFAPPVAAWISYIYIIQRSKKFCNR
jgi:hypothetical protein